MLKIKKLHPDAVIPTKNNQTDVGYDLYALEDAEICSAGSPTKVRTGVAVEIVQNQALDSNQVSYGQIMTRSSLASKGIIATGGVIDPGYRGEVLVVLNSLLMGHVKYHIKKGDKIAQLVVLSASNFEVKEVDELTSSERAAKGFGSSGR